MDTLHTLERSRKDQRCGVMANLDIDDRIPNIGESVLSVEDGSASGWEGNGPLTTCTVSAVALLRPLKLGMDSDPLLGRKGRPSTAGPVWVWQQGFPC